MNEKRLKEITEESKQAIKSLEKIVDTLLNNETLKNDSSLKNIKKRIVSKESDNCKQK